MPVKLKTGNVEMRVCVALVAFVSVAACVKELPSSASKSAATYAACGVIGAYDRVFISKRDDRKGTCTRIGLASPSTENVVLLAVPSGWSVEMAAISNHPSDCERSGSLSAGALSATGASGSIRWSAQTGAVIPGQLSVQATLTFSPSGSASWAPASDELIVEALPVGSCVSFK